MGAFRWTPEAVEAFEKRQAKFAAEGRVTTHRIEKTLPGVDIDAIHKNPKYRNKITVVDGIKFHSKREATRHADLVLLEKAGEISDLQRQVKFRLVVNEIAICSYIADFTYQQAGKLIVEDSKGFKTEGYKLKAKLMLACHGIAVLET